MYPYPAEVKYRDINQKPDYFKDIPSWNDLLTTKAKEWAHEQEVRLITKDPMWIHAGRDIPQKLYNEELVDGKEIRHDWRICSSKSAIRHRRGKYDCRRPVQIVLLQSLYRIRL